MWAEPEMKPCDWSEEAFPKIRTQFTLIGEKYDEIYQSFIGQWNIIQRVNSCLHVYMFTVSLQEQD